MDCGPTCLQIIIRHYGRRVKLESIKEASQISVKGVSLLGLAEAAGKFGFDTACSRLTFDQLIKEVPLPCILLWKKNHFVVLTPSIGNRSVTIADPANGLLTFSKDEFLENWAVNNPGSTAKGVSLLLSPRKEFYDREDEDAAHNFLAKEFWKYKGKIVQLLSILTFCTAVQFSFPYLTQYLVDKGISGKDVSFIKTILLAQFVILLSQSAAQFWRSRLLLFISMKINISVLDSFWIKILKLPLSFFGTKQTGDILQRVYDHRKIEDFITGSAIESIISIFNLIVFSAILWTYNSKIFAVFLTGATLYFAINTFFLRKRKVIEHNRFEASAKLGSATMHLINGMQEIKLNNAEQLYRKQWQKLQKVVLEISAKSLNLTQRQQGFAFVINHGKNFLISYISAHAVVMEQMTLGTMVAIQYLLGQLNNPLELLISFSQDRQEAKIALERLNEIQSMNDEDKVRTQTLEAQAKYDIIFKEVTFQYPGTTNRPVLSNLNIEFKAGEITAIVGQSGSGKTTILKLIQQFYESYIGCISVGQVDLRDVIPSNWRSIFGCVTQDGYIFSDTIERNIVINEENPDYDRLIQACKVASILDFIQSLPMGFKSRIGAEGNGISAGQRQRILIARAVYKDPAYIFFDEATNALDARNEKTIMENLYSFFRRRTVVIVAHRLSTVRYADKIVVLHGGEISEQGSHEELILQKGKYYELVQNQMYERIER